jgi:hypothetical protein
MQITYEKIGSDYLFASTVGLGVHLIKIRPPPARVEGTPQRCAFLHVRIRQRRPFASTWWPRSYGVVPAAAHT